MPIVYQCVSEKVAVRVAVRSWSATRARHEIFDLGQGTSVVGVVVAGRVCVDPERTLSSAGTVLVGTASCYSHYQIVRA